jgi:hypothetical protein
MLYPNATEIQLISLVVHRLVECSNTFFSNSFARGSSARVVFRRHWTGNDAVVLDHPLPNKVIWLGMRRVRNVRLWVSAGAELTTVQIHVGTGLKPRQVLVYIKNDKLRDCYV